MAERGMTRAHMPTANTEGVVPDLNPYLEVYRNPRRSPNAGSGQIFGKTERDLIVWQTRPALPSDYELGLASTLEQIFAQRIYELPDIVAALNREGVRTPDDQAWTEQNFQAAFRELGKLAFG
jgi:hypothetical protein